MSVREREYLPSEGHGNVTIPISSMSKGRGLKLLVLERGGIRVGRSGSGLSCCRVEEGGR